MTSGSRQLRGMAWVACLPVCLLARLPVDIPFTKLHWCVDRWLERMFGDSAAHRQAIQWTVSFLHGLLAAKKSSVMLLMLFPFGLPFWGGETILSWVLRGRGDGAKG